MLVVDFNIYFMVVKTKTYTSVVSTLPKSISNKTAVKK